MAFRITTVVEGKGTTIRVEGRLSAEGVSELRREAQDAAGIIKVDLSGLISADGVGLKELLDLSSQGARLWGESAYVRQLLDETC